MACMEVLSSIGIKEKSKMHLKEGVSLVIHVMYDKVYIVCMYV